MLLRSLVSSAVLATVLPDRLLWIAMLHALLRAMWASAMQSLRAMIP
jgi:hypothetical protein